MATTGTAKALHLRRVTKSLRNVRAGGLETTLHNLLQLHHTGFVWRIVGMMHWNHGHDQWRVPVSIHQVGSLRAYESQAHSVDHMTLYTEQLRGLPEEESLIRKHLSGSLYPWQPVQVVKDHHKLAVLIPMYDLLGLV